MKSIPNKTKRKGWPLYKSEELKGIWKLILGNSKVQEWIKEHPEEKSAILNWISYGIYRYSKGDVKLGAKNAYYLQAVEPGNKPNYNEIRELQNYLAKHGHDPKSQRRLDTLLKAEAAFTKQRKTVRVKYEIPSLEALITAYIDDYLEGVKSQKYINRKQFAAYEGLGEMQVYRIFRDRFGGSSTITKEEYRKYKQLIEAGLIIRRTRKKKK